MKILLTGSRSFGAAVYERLKADGHEVVCVCCPIENKKDKLTIAAINNKRSIGKIIQSGTLNSDSCPDGVDLIVAAHSHDFVGRKTRHRARFGAIGYHPSLLPLHRGRDAVKWTVKMKDNVAGGSVYWLNETVDGGPIAAQRHVVTGGKLGSKELWSEHLFPMGVDLLSIVCSEVENGSASAINQDHTKATWEPAISGRPLLHRPDLILLGFNGLKLNQEGSASR